MVSGCISENIQISALCPPTDGDILYYKYLLFMSRHCLLLWQMSKHASHEGLAHSSRIFSSYVSGRLHSNHLPQLSIPCMQDCTLSLYYFAQLVLHVGHPAETELYTPVDAWLKSSGCPPKSVVQTNGGLL
jgi:hypothetical protein